MTNDERLKAMERARRNSLKESRREVQGEYYVSRSSEKEEKRANALKTMLSVCVIALAAGFVGNMEFATAVRHEAVSSSNAQFVDYINELNDFELNSLYDETIKGMEKEEARILEEVVDQMEEDYVEENGRGSK